MAKTLADMTAEERAECVGMWCDNLVSTADNPQPVVLACVQGERCWILHTNLHGEWSCFSLGSVSPRPDLPRAWTPDGEPVPGEWGQGNELAINPSQPQERRNDHDCRTKRNTFSTHGN